MHTYTYICKYTYTYIHTNIHIHICKSIYNLSWRGNTRILASRQQTLTVCQKNDPIRIDYKAIKTV